MRLSVLVPTFRRTDALGGCFDALRAQERPPDEVILVVRDIDTSTWEFLKSDPGAGLPLKIITVTEPGQVAALNAGLEAVTGDVVCITDDDSKPWKEWLARIEAHFGAEAKLGGVGGRDWVYHKTHHDGGTAPLAGQVQWHGRPVGNHHLDAPKNPDADFLKGANMSYRMAAVGKLRFDTRLLGTGAQVHNDMAFGLTLKKSGWKILWDPAVAIDHFPADRFDEDARRSFNPAAYFNMVHNETYVLVRFLPPVRGAVYLLWSSLVGTRSAFGLVQALRFAPREKGMAFQKLGQALKARASGARAARRMSVD